MAWLARSLANSLHLDDDTNEEDVSESENESSHRYDTVPLEDPPTVSSQPSDEYLDLRSSDDLDNQGRGMKEDLSEFRDSLARQLLGVASFLAPPPPPPPPPPPRHLEFPLESKLDNLVLEDLEEYGSKSESVDSCANAAEIEHYCENMEGAEDHRLNLVDKEDYYADLLDDAVGITEEVLAFATNIAHHPETWLDFPLSDEEEFEDFDISDAQCKHALAIEHLAPRLAALRFELCPVHMTEGYFWMVYFVLLHSRLNKHDSDLLSSPQLVQARAMWMQELHKRTKESSSSSYWSGITTLHSKESEDSPRENYTIHYTDEDTQVSSSEPAMHHSTNVHEFEINQFDYSGKHMSDEVEFVDKSVIREDPSAKFEEKEMIVPAILVNDYELEDDDDDWINDDDPDLVGYSGASNAINEEDISFSDLEDDTDYTIPIKSKTVSTEWNDTKTDRTT